MEAFLYMKGSTIIFHKDNLSHTELTLLNLKSLQSYKYVKSD